MSSLVLVVDDETNIIDVCTVYLQREGYQVIAATNGEEAIRLWRLHRPQLILLDLMMPGKNGWQVCEEIRNDLPNSNDWLHNLIK
ncbi:response regulator [Paenibacillus sp. N3.4]|uniref:response regulator n=1 Tax=Paenibacillus sp. N3.4 TaxID=2603222 RepID=UPI0011CCAB3A|nr:response regulator [Paenibacillus sp. N3.4]TXK85232.1 response regulator [Paenibacillus sp. N3.4]